MDDNAFLHGQNYAIRFAMMEQNTRVPCVNRAERIRNRALLHYERTRDVEGYWKLVRLSLEAHTIR